MTKWHEYCQKGVTDGHSDGRTNWWDWRVAFIKVVIIELRGRSRNGKTCGRIRYISIYSSPMNIHNTTSPLTEDSIKFHDLPTSPCLTLTHWGRMTHIGVGKLIVIGSVNGLSPGRRQTITWTNARILLIWPLGTNFNEISFKKMHLKMSSAKWRPFCLGLNRLIVDNIVFFFIFPFGRECIITIEIKCFCFKLCWENIHRFENIAHEMIIQCYTN